MYANLRKVNANTQASALLLFSSLAEFWNHLWVSSQNKILEIPSIVFYFCSENGWLSPAFNINNKVPVWQVNTVTRLARYYNKMHKYLLLGACTLHMLEAEKYIPHVKAPTHRQARAHVWRHTHASLTHASVEKYHTFCTHKSKCM